MKDYNLLDTSPDWRVTVNFGFHRRSSVLGVKGGGVCAPAVYDAERIRTRSRVIGYAIDARTALPGRNAFPYKPFVMSGEHYCWDEEAEAGMKDYNLLDFSLRHGR